MTSDLRRRFAEHKEGKNFSTKYDKSWVLIYYEAYLQKGLALEREKRLKNFGSAFGHLRKRLGFKKGGAVQDFL